MRINFLFLIVLLGVTSILLGKNLYVDGATGNDAVSYSNNSISNPWATLGRAVWGSPNRNSPNSSEGAQAGDSVIVAAGTYHTTQGSGERYEPIYNPVNNGSPNNPIIFYANGEVWLTENNGQEEPIIGSYQRSWIVWHGFSIDQNNINPLGDGGTLSAWYADHIWFRNCTVIGTYLAQGEDNNHNGVRFESSTYVYLQNTLVTDVTGNSGRNDSGVTLYYCQNAYIENCTIDGCETGIYLKGLNDGPIIVRYNIISNSGDEALIVHRSFGGQIYQNLFIDNPNFAIILATFPDPAPRNFDIVNNTAYNCESMLTTYYDPPYNTNIRFYNNVSHTMNAGHVYNWYSTFGDVTIDYNGYFNSNPNFFYNQSGRTWSYWQSNVGFDANGLYTDPFFVNASLDSFQLQAGSPMINAGLDILDLDNDGSTNDPITMGAYITGNEIIGIISGGYTPQIPPIKPTGLLVDP